MCTEGFGCSGPGNFVGVGGCVSCEVGIVDDRELNVVGVTHLYCVDYLGW